MVLIGTGYLHLRIRSKFSDIIGAFYPKITLSLKFLLFYSDPLKVNKMNFRLVCIRKWDKFNSIDYFFATINVNCVNLLTSNTSHEVHNNIPCFIFNRMSHLNI